MVAVRNRFQSDEEGVVSTELMNATGALGLPAGTKMFLVGNKDPEKNEVIFDRIEARDLDGNPVADPNDPSKPFVLQTTPVVGKATKLVEDRELKMEFDDATARQRVIDEGGVRLQAKQAEAERLAEEAKKAEGAQGPDGRHEQNVDTSSAPAEEQGGGVGGFLGDNKFGLGAGLLVGVLAAAMGGGGIVGLILGLLAMMMIGAMMDKHGMANNMLGRNKEEKSQGQGKAKETEGPAAGQTVEPEKEQANAINVKEGQDVALVKMEGTKKTYLSGQNEKGEYVYSDAPQEITLRTVNKDGVATGLIKGKVDALGENFNVSASASMLSDGRMGPLKEGSGYINLDGKGNLDLNTPALSRARKPGAEAAAEYGKQQDIALETTPDGKVQAPLGTTQVDGKDYTAIISGAMGADGKTASFASMLLKDADGKYVSGTNGAPIELALPDKQLQELAVADGKVSPMTGDVDKAKPEIAGQVLGEQKKQLDAQEKSRQGKADEVIEGMKQTADKEHARQVLHEHVSDRLQELGVTNPSERAIMSSNITNQYMDANFRNVPKEQAAETISGMVGKDEKRQTEMGDLIGRIHESVSSTIGSKAGDSAAVDPALSGQLQPDAAQPGQQPQPVQRGF